MATADAELEELQSRLVTFTDQLQSIHELLQADPQNGEFVSIAKDLVEVIQLTKEAIDLKLAAQGPTRLGEQPSQSSVSLSAASSTIQPGCMYEAENKGVWYPVYVEAAESDAAVQVHYLGFGTKETLSAERLRPIESTAGALPDKSEIATGFQCEAKYYVDSQFYTCAVTQITPFGFQVLFDGYGNSEEVPYEYMRPLSSGAATAGAVVASSAVIGAQETATTVSTAVTAQLAAAGKPVLAPIDKPIKIPENLQILPTDTDAEKERKRKRLRQIKSINRHKNIDNERNTKQNDWKTFQHKAIKKKVKGASGALTKKGESMFASPATVHGRVGVVGSGQGMTEFQDARKKPKHA